MRRPSWVVSFSGEVFFPSSAAPVVRSFRVISVISGNYDFVVQRERHELSERAFSDAFWLKNPRWHLCDVRSAEAAWCHLWRKEYQIGLLKTVWSVKPLLPPYTQSLHLPCNIQTHQSSSWYIARQLDYSKTRGPKDKCIGPKLRGPQYGRNYKRSWYLPSCRW